MSSIEWLKKNNEALTEKPPEWLKLFQVTVAAWAAHNFPSTTVETPERPLLGAVEELGELAHAHLKAVQGIRGMSDEAKTRAAKEDAVGDILVYLAHYCALSDLSMAEAVQNAWREVMDRDWIKYPGTGRPPEDEEWDPATGTGTKRVDTVHDEDETQS